jgi:peroxiredoxin
MEINMFRLFYSLFILTLSIAAQETKDPAAGHSYHGEVFNEGPRQAARLLGGTGQVEFEITTNSSKTKQFFLQGVGQLHGFWYFEAERSFRQAAVTDKQCAMAYWGMAMANISNEKRARAFLAQAYKYIDSASEREKMYIDSYAMRIGLPKDEAARKKYLVNPKDFKVKADEKSRRGTYVKELEKIVLKFPDDLEAKAFLVMNLWNNTYKGHKLNSHVAVNSLANEILAKKPLHPTHHYRIHLWDKKNPEQALNSAARCGQGAPSIAHMWHMPGHIFSRLNRFADAAWQQEASARTDHRHMMRDFTLPDQIHNFAHNNEWLTRNLMNLGDTDRAFSLVKNMIDLPQHPKYNTPKKGSASYGRQRLSQLLNTFEMWEEALALKDSVYLEKADILNEQMKRLRLLGRAYYSLGKHEQGNLILDEARELQSKIIKQEITKYEKKKKDAAKKKSVEASKKLAKTKKKPETSKKVGKVETEKKPETSKKVAKVEKKKRPKSKSEENAEDTIKELRVLKVLEESTALAEFKDLSGLDKWLEVQIYLKQKKFDEALKISEESYKDNTNKVVHMARYTYTLFKAGKKEKSKEIFEQLRQVSEFTKLSTRPIEMLAPIAKEFDYPLDWRIKKGLAKDVGHRPRVNSLGPFRWQPVQADDWTLADSTGQRLHFAKLNKNQPYIVIFYLGADCLHCVEQLNAFAPVKEKFAQEGIKIIAVSLENTFDLKSSVDNYSDTGAFPFPIVSDSGLNVFKQYKCYDDFEKMALHGTFLIDGKSRIRWLDISYEPFTNTEFLLKESKRLLRQKLD